MSFFKKLTDEFKGLKTKDEKGSQESGQASRDTYGDHGQQYPPMQRQYGQNQGQPSYGQQEHGYGAPPSSYPPMGTNYGQPPQVTPSHAMAPDPPGWSSRFDPVSNRPYYVTILSQWEPPTYARDYGTPASSASYFEAPPGNFVPSSNKRGNMEATRSFGDGGAAYHNQSYGNTGNAGYGQQYHKDDSNKKMMMGAAGGLAVGGLAGAYAAHEMTEDEHGNPVPAGSAGYGASTQTAAVDGSAPPGVLPATDADGDSVSSSDREDVQEARADYEDAVANGSQSDIEEAREEYQEEYEETYED